MRKAVGAVAALLVLAVLLGCGGGLVEQPKAKPARTREDVKKLVMGKTKQEVLDLLGRPDSTSELSSGEGWRYKEVSFDPVANKTDPTTWIYFNKAGKADDVRF